MNIVVLLDHLNHVTLANLCFKVIFLLSKSRWKHLLYFNAYFMQEKIIQCDKEHSKNILIFLQNNKSQCTDLVAFLF